MLTDQEKATFAKGTDQEIQKLIDDQKEVVQKELLGIGQRYGRQALLTGLRILETTPILKRPLECASFVIQTKQYLEMHP